MALVNSGEIELGLPATLPANQNISSEFGDPNNDGVYGLGELVGVATGIPATNIGFSDFYGLGGTFPTAWQSRVEITEANNSPGITGGFVALLTEANLPADIWTTALDGGGDLRVTTSSSGTTRLPLEVVKFDITTQTAILWVRFPSFSSGTSLWLFYGRAGVTQPAVNEAFGRNSVWVDQEAQYKFGSAVGSVVDSSGKKSNLTATGDWTLNSEGYWQSAGAPGTRVNAAFSGGNPASATMTWRTRVPNLYNYGPAMGLNNVAGWDKSGYMHGSSDSGGIIYSGFSVAQRMTPGSAQSTVWQIVNLVRDGAAYTLYADGVQVASGNFTAPTINIDGIDFRTEDGGGGGVVDLEYIGYTNTAKSANLIGTEHTNQSSPAAFWTTGTPQAVSGGVAFPNDWSRRVQITESNGSAAVTGYVALITGSNLPADIWTIASDGGGDLRVTSDIDGTNPLPLEVVNFNTTLQSAELRVRFPILAATTSFWLFYGNSNATQPPVTDPIGRNAVWTERYQRFHLDEITGTVIEDSSGTLDGTYEAPMPRVGINGGQDFSAADTGKGVLGTANSLDLSLFTISATLRPDNTGSNRQIISSDDSNSGERYWQFRVDVNDRLNVIVWDAGGSLFLNMVGSIVLSTVVASTVSVTYNGSLYRLYVNGVLDVASTSVQPQTKTGNSSYYLGARMNNTVENFDGEIFNAEIWSGSFKSGEYIAVEHANESTPFTFWTTGLSEDINGLSYLSFNGTNQSVTFTPNPTVDPTWELEVVVADTSFRTSGTLGILSQAGSTGSFLNLVDTTSINDPELRVAYRVNFSSIINLDLPAGEPRDIGDSKINVIKLRYDGTQLNASLNDNTTLSITITNPGFILMDTIALTGGTANFYSLKYWSDDTRTNLVLHFDPFSAQGTGLVLPDIAGNNDGTLVGYAGDDSQWFYTGSTTPVAGFFITLDGVDDYIDIPNSAPKLFVRTSYNFKMRLNLTSGLDVRIYSRPGDSNQNFVSIDAGGRVGIRYGFSQLNFNNSGTAVSALVGSVFDLEIRRDNDVHDLYINGAYTDTFSTSAVGSGSDGFSFGKSGVFFFPYSFYTMSLADDALGNNVILSYNASDSNGTGSILPDSIAGNDATLIGFATDGSQWTSFGGPPPVELFYYLRIITQNARAVFAPVTIGQNIGDYVEFSGFALAGNGNNRYGLIGTTVNYDGVLEMQPTLVLFRPDNAINYIFSTAYVQPPINQDFIIRVERTDTNTWTCYLDTFFIGSVTTSLNFTFDQFFSFASVYSSAFQGGLYYVKVSNDGGTSLAHHWDPSASSGEGSNIPDTVGGNNAVLGGFPTDNSQWVLYTPINKYRLNFDGVNDQVLTPNFVSTIDKIEFVIDLKVDSIPSTTTRMFALNSIGTNGPKLNFGFQSGRFRVNTVNAAGSPLGLSTLTFPDGVYRRVFKIWYVASLGRIEWSYVDSDNNGRSGATQSSAWAGQTNLNAPITIGYDPELSGRNAFELYSLKVLLDDVLVSHYDPTASNGTGLTLPDIVGNADAALTNFPNDDSQWLTDTSF